MAKVKVFFFATESRQTEQKLDAPEYHSGGKGVGEGGAGGHKPPHFQKWGAQVGLCPPPPPHTLLGRANVLISLFAHILWLKTHFFQNFLGSLRSPTLINQYFLNFANLKL